MQRLFKGGYYLRAMFNAQVLKYGLLLIKSFRPESQLQCLDMKGSVLVYNLSINYYACTY